MTKYAIRIILLMITLLIANAACCGEFSNSNNGYGITAIQEYISRSGHKCGKNNARKIATETVKQCGKTVPVSIAIAIMEVESEFNRKASSGKGDEGLMQIRYRIWKKKYGIKNRKDLYVIEKNIKIGISILKHYIKISGGNINTALRKYSGGRNSKRLAYSRKILRKARIFARWEKSRKRSNKHVDIG